MFESILELDRKLFLLLNSLHNGFFDFIFYWASNRWIWIPFYAYFLYLIFRHFGKSSLLIMILVALLITISDQVSASVVKEWAQRLRPCHDPTISSQVHLVNGHCGGRYGFFSSHAANASAVAVFLALILPKQLIAARWMLAIYLVLVCYSRIYLGVHFPGDVLAGLVFGTLLSVIFAAGFFYLQRRRKNKSPAS